nr:hypothetical protein [Tanacetum cinerariifolium]
MSVFYISVSSHDERTSSSILCIIMTDSKAVDVTFPVAPASLSPHYVPALRDYTPDSDLDSEPFEEDPKEADLKESLHPNGSLMMLTLRKRVHTPITLSPAIEAAIAEEIVVPPRKRARLSPSAASPSTPSSPPALPLSLPYHMLPPRKRFRMTPLQIEATEETFKETPTETTAPTRLRKREVLLERIETLELEVDTLHNRAEAIEQQTKDLQVSLGRARDEIAEHHIRHEDVKARLQQSGFREIELKIRIRILEDRFGIIREMIFRRWNLSSGTCQFRGNVTSSKPQRIKEVIRMAHDLMDQRVRERTAKNGEKNGKEVTKNNLGQQNK